jgi:AraC-like DNA-binding protein
MVQESMEYRTIWSKGGAEVLLTKWHGARHPAERAGCTRSAVIEFMRTGCYARRLGRREVLIDPNHVAFFKPFETFRVNHPCVERNTGLTLRVSRDLLARVVSRQPSGHVSFERMFAISSPRCHLLQDQLVGTLLGCPAADPLRIEELLRELVHEAVSMAPDSPSGGKPWRAQDTAPGDIDRVETVRRHLIAHWPERVTLQALADRVDCSRWHLAWLFRAQVGLPIYHYLKRLRVRHALARIRDGCPDLTRVALECGFSSHSHFSMAFRQEFGTTPSAVRSG